MPAISHADEFKAIPTDKSTPMFVYMQIGVNMEGQIEPFTARDFDFMKLGTAKAEIDHEISNTEVGSSRGNGDVIDNLWRSGKADPKLSFVASSVKALSDNRSEVNGPLSINGRANMVTSPVILTPQRKSGTLDGALVIKRADFSTGEDSWACHYTHIF